MDVRFKVTKMVEIIEVVFWINLILALLLIIGIVISIIFPRKRIWPPPSKEFPAPVWGEVVI